MRVVVVGEGMVELSRAGEGWRVGYGGDALNVAIHLARFGRDVAFLTALGGDPFSADLRAAWAAEGLDTSLMLADPAAVTGLYAIRTDDRGERSFAYWRSASAARGMFGVKGMAAALDAAAQADLLVFSLISLAVLPADGRAALLRLAGRVRARGGRVAFDGNFRPALWVDPGEALAARDAALALCDIGLPTLEDERSLAGSATAEAVQSAWRRKGAGEVVVKDGAAGCLLPDGRMLAPSALLDPVDTSGAGDAFDAGYLHARLAGAEPAAAAAVGHRIAGWAVMRRGAIPPVDDDAPYR